MVFCKIWSSCLLDRICFKCPLETNLQNIVIFVILKILRWFILLWYNISEERMFFIRHNSCVVTDGCWVFFILKLLIVLSYTTITGCRMSQTAWFLHCMYMYLEKSSQYVHFNIMGVYWQLVPCYTYWQSIVFVTVYVCCWCKRFSLSFDNSRYVWV